MRGFGLIEILVASAIISGALVGLSATAQIAASSVGETARRAEARILAEEALEAVRTLRDASWSANIAPRSTGTAYFPVFATGTNAWTLSTTSPGLTDGVFERRVTFNTVHRDDSTDDIVPGGGSGTYEDAGTRQVTARVLWGEKDTEAEAFAGGMTDADLASFPSDDAGDGDPAQGITTPADEASTVSSVEIPVRRVEDTTPSDIYLEIRSGSTVGTVVATSNTIAASTLPDDELTWTAFSFPTSPELAPDTAYYVRLRSDPPSTEPFSGSEGRIHWGYEQSNPSAYGGGTAWRYIGRNGDEDDAGQQLTDYDFSFRLNKEETGAKEMKIETYMADVFDN